MGARRLNLDFAGLCLIVLLFNVPYLKGTFLPFHDTMYTFQVFHLFYSEWLFNGDIAHWIPYGSFGLASNYYQLAFLTPMSYLLGLIGGLFRVTDALWLFKVSVVCEQVVLLLGTYLLSRRLYVRRSTVILVCLAVIGSTVWHRQFSFNFRIFYLWPLVTYFFVAFVEERRPLWLWLAGLAGLTWVLGNPLYFVVLWGFLFVILLMGLVLCLGQDVRPSQPFIRSVRNLILLALFSVVAMAYVYRQAHAREFTSAVLWMALFTMAGWALFVKHRGRWDSLVTASPENLIPLALFGIVALAYMAHLGYAREFTSMMSPGRNPPAGWVGPGTFLYYGSHPSLGPLLRSWLFGWPSHMPSSSDPENTIYAGLAIVFFFLWAVVHVRAPVFLAMASALGALVWLSWGGLFATAVYFEFPKMSLYRHIGLVFGLAKLLVIVCAGFGWERFWSSRPTIRWRPVLLGLIIAGFLVDCFVLGVNPVGGARPAPTHVFRYWHGEAFGWILGGGAQHLEDVWAVIVVLRLGIYAALIGLGLGVVRWVRSTTVSRGGAVRVAVIVGLLLDLLSYQFAVYAEAPKLPASLVADLEALNASQLSFQEQRTPEPNPVQQRAMRLITWPGEMSAVYGMASNLTRHDPCIPGKESWSSAGVRRLFRAVGHREADLEAIIGCTAPKLRLLPDAVEVDTIDDATRLLEQIADLQEVVVVRGSGRASVVPVSRVAGSPEPGIDSLQVTRFSVNEVVVEAEVKSSDGAWLVYADAFHPGWRATVNGTPVPIAEAYLAFKAVWLQTGLAVVRFTFQGLRAFLDNTIAMIGLFMGLGLAGLAVKTLVGKGHAR